MGHGVPFMPSCDEETIVEQVDDRSGWEWQDEDDYHNHVVRVDERQVAQKTERIAHG